MSGAHVYVVGARLCRGHTFMSGAHGYGGGARLCRGRTFMSGAHVYVGGTPHELIAKFSGQ